MGPRRSEAQGRDLTEPHHRLSPTGRPTETGSLGARPVRDNPGSDQAHPRPSVTSRPIRPRAEEEDEGADPSRAHGSLTQGDVRHRSEGKPTGVKPRGATSPPTDQARSGLPAGSTHVRPSRRGADVKPRFEAIHGYALCAREGRCRECGKKVTGRRKSWCSDACVTAYRVRAHPAFARKLVEDRDGGICALCGLDCKEPERARADALQQARRVWWVKIGIHPDSSCKPVPNLLASYAGFVEIAEPMLRARLEPWGLAEYWKRETFWDADHIIAYAKVGNDLGLKGLRTLCVLCHSKRTRAQAVVRLKASASRATRET